MRINLNRLQRIQSALEMYIQNVIPNRETSTEEQIIQCSDLANRVALRYKNLIDREVVCDDFVESGILKFEEGMNSHGILFDRLTILLCKKYLAAPEYFSIEETAQQIKGVGKSLSYAALARTPMLAKEATTRITSAPESLGTALISLQLSNILMWINQDLLYTTNVNNVSESRLRDYIKFFGTSNSSRNLAIESIDLWVSNKFTER